MASIDSRNAWVDTLADVGIISDGKTVFPICCLDADGTLLGAGLQIIHEGGHSTRLAYDVKGHTLQWIASRMRRWVDAGAGPTSEAHYFETMGQIEELEAARGIH